jgi:hypothetical protein
MSLSRTWVPQLLPIQAQPKTVHLAQGSCVSSRNVVIIVKIIVILILTIAVTCSFYPQQEYTKTPAVCNAIDMFQTEYVGYPQANHHLGAQLLLSGFSSLISPLTLREDTHKYILL